MKNLILLFCLLCSTAGIAQVSITPDGTNADNSAMLDVKSTTKGLLIPRMTMANRDVISSPAAGLMIYQTDNTPGFYYYNGTAWTLVGSNAGQWQTNGNDIYYNTGNVGIGTTLPAAKFDVTGGDAMIHGLTIGRGSGSVISNTVLGRTALISNTTEGTNNTAIGSDALFLNSTGDYNSATGSSALFYNNSGSNNTAHGYSALLYNTTGSNNTATGADALYYNSTGEYNVAVGNGTLLSNKANSRSTAIGYHALYYADDRTTGQSTYNTAVGYEALRGSTTPANNTGQYNTALGDQALYSNTTAYFNTGVGYKALYANSVGYYNTALGSMALAANTVGNANCGVGTFTLGGNTSGLNNSAFGYGALSGNTTGSNNTAIGANALIYNIVNSRSTAVGNGAMFYADSRITNARSTYNTAVGYSALAGSIEPSLNTGQYNTAIGDESLFLNTSGYNNTAIGASSMHANAAGYSNTSIGYLSLENNVNGYRNTGVGLASLQGNLTGYGNTAVGSSSGELYTNITNAVFIGRGAMADAENLTNCIAIGYSRRNTASNQVRIGNTDMTSIGGQVGWSTLSDGRFKTDINPNVPGLAFILTLQPVTYKIDVYKLAEELGEDEVIDENGNRVAKQLSDLDRKSRDEKAAITYTGFIAQDVETAAKSIGFDFSGVDAPKNENDIYALRYAEFVVPLVKAIQEQQAIIGEQQKEIDELKIAVKNLMSR